MIIIVAYDISREEIRGRLRRYLARLGLAMVNRSVYAGVGGEATARKIAEKYKKILEGSDNIFIIVVPETYYHRAYMVTSGDYYKIQSQRYEIL